MKKSSIRLIPFLLLIFFQLMSVIAYAGQISGTVRNLEGEALEGISVRLHVWEPEFQWWRSGRSTTTDASGNYELNSLPDGRYRVQFNDWTRSYAPEVFPGFHGQISQGGASLEISGQNQITGVDAVLLPAASIKGSVFGGDQEPLPSVSVTAHRWGGQWWEQVAWTETDSEGQFELAGLPPGEYRVMFDDFSSDYVAMTYPDSFGWPSSGGESLILDVGETRENINMQLIRGGGISGTVISATDSQPLDDAHVTAYRLQNGQWVHQRSGTTGSAGMFELSGLAPGTYRVMFYRNSFVQEVYNSIPDQWVSQAGTNIEVFAGQITDGIDATLQQLGRISGLVTQADGTTPLSDITVQIRNGWRSSRTDADGHFEIELPPGQYQLLANPFGWFHGSEWLGEVYGGGFLPANWTWWNEEDPGGTVLTLGSGESLENIDFSLKRGGHIRGSVTADIGEFGSKRLKLLSDDQNFERWGVPGEDGEFSFKGLLPGTYFLKAEASDSASLWWEGASHLDEAQEIVVEVEREYEKNFELHPGQSPAWVEVKSDPPGAAIYLDYHPTGQTTPSVINVGEVDSFNTHGIASHVISLRPENGPRPAPRTAFAGQAETVSMSFDLTSTESGSLSISTEPAGAEVYVNFADASEGVTPLVLNHLAPGSHTLLLRKDGYLQPRPIIARVYENDTTQVHLSLHEITHEPEFQVEVESHPAGVPVYINYLKTDLVSNAVVSGFDPAAPQGTNWYSASHTIQLRAEGLPPTAPRILPNDQADSVPLFFDLSVLNFDPPSILESPGSLRIPEFSPALFSVVAEGLGLNFQWEVSKDQGQTWTLIEGANAAVHEIDSVGAEINGYLYRVSVSNPAGALYSDRAEITVLLPPRILDSPVDQSVQVPDSAEFSVMAEGTEPLFYQWEISEDGGVTWSSIPGATSGNYQTEPGGISRNNTRFRVRVENEAGHAVSEGAVLTVLPGPEVDRGAFGTLRKTDVRRFQSHLFGDIQFLAGNENWAFSYGLQTFLAEVNDQIFSPQYGWIRQNLWGIERWILSDFFGLVHFGRDAEEYSGWVYSERFGWMRFVDAGGGSQFLWVQRLQTWMAVNHDGSFHSFDFGWLVPEAGSLTRYNSRVGILIDDEQNPAGWLRSDRFGFVWFARDGTGVWFWSSSRNEWIGITPDGGLWSTAEGRFL
jgi:5-hydroxyisourate hydrolase-like protein (transthyretin family)